MPLTRSFKETTQARVQRDPAFRAALLAEAVDALQQNDLATGKILLRDYINATIGFEELSAATDIPVKSLMRMLGAEGNPRMTNIFAIIEQLQVRTHTRIVTEAVVQ